MRFRGAVKWTDNAGVCLHRQSDQLANLEFNNALPSGDMIEMDDLPAACAFEKVKADPRRDRLGARKGLRHDRDRAKIAFFPPMTGG